MSLNGQIIGPAWKTASKSLLGISAHVHIIFSISTKTKCVCAISTQQVFFFKLNIKISYECKTPNVVSAEMIQITSSLARIYLSSTGVYEDLT